MAITSLISPWAEFSIAGTVPEIKQMVITQENVTPVEVPDFYRVIGEQPGGDQVPGLVFFKECGKTIGVTVLGGAAESSFQIFRCPSDRWKRVIT